MKKLIILLSFFFFFIPIPPYIECNHLTIISEIEVTCNSSYEIIYHEVIPLKEDNGIKYHYKKYKVYDDNLLMGIQRIEQNKNIYKNKAKYTVLCPNKKEIIKIIKEA